MAGPWYVRSGAAGTADGLSWTNAMVTLAAAATASSAGDTIYVSEDHAETAGAAKTITFPGTIASPNIVICGDHAAEPPTAVATTATVTTTSTFNITLNGSFYCYGITFSGATGAANNGVTVCANAGRQVFDHCGLANGATSGSGAFISFGLAGSPAEAVLFDTNIKLGHAGASLWPACDIKIRGGGLASGTANPTALFTVNTATARGCDVSMEGFDFSNATSTMCLVAGGASAGSNMKFRFVDNKMPTSWTHANLFSSVPTTASIEAEFVNGNAGAVNYSYKKQNYFGTVVEEATNILTGGASDGTTPFSLKMVSTANCKWPRNELRGPKLAYRNETTGSAKTLTVEFAQNSSATALAEKDFRLEARYLGSSATPIGTFIHDGVANPLPASNPDQTTSAASWAALTSPTTQKAAVSLTPQMKGIYEITPILTAASKTVYVDQLVTVS